MKTKVKKTSAQNPKTGAQIFGTFTGTKSSENFEHYFFGEIRSKTPTSAQNFCESALILKFFGRCIDRKILKEYI